MTSPPSPRLVILGSGSSGNSCAVADGTTTLLIDCGFSAREIAKRLASVSIDAASVSAILVTHEHSDHVRGIDVFCRRHAHDCVVYSTEKTWLASGLGAQSDRWAAVKAGEPWKIGGLEVVAFRTSHDAADPVGYRISTAGGCLGVATDTGVFTPEAAEALAGCELIGLEANHDARMLEYGPYPAFLKRRIASRHGHLSNEQAADALESLAHDGLETVFAMHRSRKNNTGALAAAALESRLANLDLKVRVKVAEQDSVIDSDPAQGSLFRG